MKAINKLYQKLKGEKALTVPAILILMVGVLFFVSLPGVLFIWGLNLLGFAIPYNIETVIGALVILFLTGGLKIKTESLKEKES